MWPLPHARVRIGLECVAVTTRPSSYRPRMYRPRPDVGVVLKGIYPEFQVIRGFSQKIPAGLLSYDQIHS